ncbi:MAG: chemotaxis protein CheB [Campylobacterota bacterium]|nr:chemotaxis protein CheB [Campylobacterota bacterium]
MQESIYIGIGTSAGGLKALERLLSKLPTKMNYVYIIAQHLTPDKDSLLAHILSRSTSMPVEEATPECKFSSNHVYIIPPSYNLAIKQHRLLLEKLSSKEHTTTPSIDMMLESIALYKKKSSVGIILTGAGHDGTLGVQKIKENGGLAIAQSPEEAEYDSMPKAAINAGNIDYILNIEDIAGSLSSMIMDSRYTQDTPTPYALKTIKNILHEKENFNTHKYKNETIIRRINKRMLLLHINTLEEYLVYLQKNQKETRLLYEDILIGVTSFFRDAKAFESLGNQLYDYLKDKPQDYKFRVWSIACSTGEEAYSLAILISQVSKRLKREFKVNIFATDIDNSSLKIARKAYYKRDSFDDIDKELLNEYFVPFKKGYKVISSLRDQIVFTEHNLLSDPPFIKQDIISCRNLLIYLLPEAQQELFTLFHHSLKEHALLFLGSSESTLVSTKYFLGLDTEQKIYQKEQLTNPPKISSHFFSKHTQQKSNKANSEHTNNITGTIEERISDSIFNYFAPNFVLIDKDYSIIYKKGDLPFINLQSGFVTLNILENINSELKYALKELLNSAFSSFEVQSTKFIELNIGPSEKTFVRVIANPFNDSNNSSMLLLYFQELQPQEIQFHTDSLLLPDESLMIKSLMTQLDDVREKNHTLLDELSINKENMQLMNEELQSSNEELQSSNEELETSNEELQSSNEELHASILNIQKLQDQLSLILNSTRDGIIGLDLDGNHMFVNVAAADMFGYTEDELIGKNGHSMWHHTKADGTHYPADECTQHRHIINGTSSRTEDLYWRKDGSSFEVEVLQNPIIENEKLIGSVLSFHDISKTNRLKRVAKHEHQLADLLMNIEGMIVLTLNTDGNITMINMQGCKLLKVNQDDVIGKNFIENFIPSDIQDEIQSVFNSVMKQDSDLVSHYNNNIVDSQNNMYTVAWSNSFLKDIDGNITGVISSGVDITEIENKDKIMLSQSRQAAMGDMLAMIAHQWRQPLSVISLVANNIRADIELDEEITIDVLKNLIHILDEQTQYLSSTIDDFKNFFKPEKDPEEIEISVVISRLMTLIQKSLENNSIELNLPKNQGIKLFTYPNQIIQILLNLINNAKDAILEFNPKDGKVDITIEKKESEVVIAVCDNGGGIDESVLNKIGQPYVSTKSKNGTGLGLYMSQIITKKYLGGKLYWENKDDGSCFYLSLPIDRE